MTTRSNGVALTPEERAQILPRVAELLRTTDSHATIAAAVGVCVTTVARMRAELGIARPAKPRQPRPARPGPSAADVLARFSEPVGEDHVRWTRPAKKRPLRLRIGGRNESVRRAVFEVHHGRQPVGYVNATCTEPGCIAGAHLVDQTLRDAGRRAERS